MEHNRNMGDHREIVNKRDIDENEEMEERTVQGGAPEDEVPEVVKEEPDDKPAGLTIQWTIVIAVAILAIIYFVFFF